MSAKLNTEQHVIERDRGRRIAEAVYGTIVLLAALDYLADEHPEAGEAALTIAGGAAVLFLARLYSEFVAQRIAVDPERGEVLGRIAAANWPVAAVAGIPVVLLLIATFGALNLDLAFDIASWYCVLVLGTAVYVAARLSNESRVYRILFTISAFGVGLFISALDEMF
jgi:hypothetical protein